MNVALTGAPGTGKTTVIRKAVALLKPLSPTGFYTEEVREGRRRTGFDIVTLDGKRGFLARDYLAKLPSVGKYGVDMEVFEDLAIPALTRKAGLYVIDEIGRMECFSEPFVDRVRELLASTDHLLATVAAKGGGFPAEVRRRKDIVLIHVTAGNRDDLPGRLARLLA